MEDLQIAAERIKLHAKLHNISLKQMLSDLKLGINTISNISNGTDIFAGNLLKIADYLDCSIDYLVGRTENSLSHKILLSEEELADNEQTAALLDFYKKFDPVEKAELLMKAAEIAKRNKD